MIPDFTAVEETIAFEKTETEDDSVSWQTKKVVQKGVVGKRARVYQVSRHNGKVVEKKLLREEVLVEAVPHNTVSGPKLMANGSISVIEIESVVLPQALVTVKENIPLSATTNWSAVEPSDQRSASTLINTGSNVMPVPSQTPVSGPRSSMGGSKPSTSRVSVRMHPSSPASSQ